MISIISNILDRKKTQITSYHDITHVLILIRNVLDIYTSRYILKWYLLLLSIPGGGDFFDTILAMTTDLSISILQDYHHHET